MNREFKVGDIVRHFKGQLYRIEGFALNTETSEEMVIYLGLYAPYKMYCRPKEMFYSEVDRKKYPQCKVKYWFELVR